MVLVEFGAIGLILWLTLLWRAVRHVEYLRIRDEKQAMLRGVDFDCNVFVAYYMVFHDTYRSRRIDWFIIRVINGKFDR